MDSRKNVFDNNRLLCIDNGLSFKNSKNIHLFLKNEMCIDS